MTEPIQGSTSTAPPAFHHHGVGVGGGDRFDQLVLSGWQGEFAIPALALDIRIETDRHHHEIGLRGELLRWSLDQLALFHDADTHEHPSDVRTGHLLQHHFVGSGAELAPGLAQDRLGDLGRIDDHLIVDEQPIAAGVLHENRIRTRAARLVPTRPALEGATVRRLRQRRKQLRCALRRERIGKSEQIRIAAEAGCPGGERGLSDGHLGRSGKGCVRKGLQVTPFFLPSR